jgi:uncharacterized protein YdaU (DUF1376 family)
MSKEKAPAFQMYPADLLSDVNVIPMSMEEFGCYMQLILICWREDSLPGSQDDLAGLCKGVMPTARVMRCFYETDGSLRHKRLDAERKKQADYAANKSLAGSIGAKSRWAKPKKRKEKIATAFSANGKTIANDSSSSSSSSSISSSTAVKREKHSHFVPDDFAVSDQDRRWAIDTRPDLNIELETEKFRNYEFKNTRSDWRKTWKNWILNAKGGVNGNGPGAPALFREQAAKTVYQQLLDEQNGRKG